MNPKVNRGEVERLRTQVAELERLLEAREQAALAQSVQTESVVKRVNGHAEALRAIASGTAAATGDEFFRSLVANLASALKVRYIYIGTLREPGRDRIATLAAWVNGGLQENIEYDLAGTPCEQVVTQGLRYYCHGVQQLFPQDHFLVEMGVESYCGTPLLDRSGRVLGLLDVLHDQPMGPMDEIGPIISIFADRAVAELERKRAEEALRDSEERFRSAFEKTAVGMVLLDNNGRFLLANRAFCTLVGYSENELLPKTFLEITHPEDLEKNLPVVKRLMAGEIESFFVEKRYLHKQGHPIWVHASVASVRDALGKPLNFIAQSQDITERKQAEEALCKNEEKFRAQYWNLPVPTYTWRLNGADWVLVEYNLAAEVFSGGHIAKLVGSKLSVLYANQPDIRRDIIGCFAEQIVLKREMPYVLRTAGERKELTVTYVPIQPDLVMVHTEDITERKWAEEALRTSEQQFSGAFENAAIGMALVAPDGRWLKVNRSLCRLTGYSAEELLNRTFQDITHPDDLERDLGYVRQMLADEIHFYHMEKRYFHKLGRTVWILLSVSLVRDAQGRPVHFIAQIQDITERKRLEEQLRQSQKMEAIGRLAGGVAHDFNNLLTVINGYSKLLLRDLEADNACREPVEEIVKAGDRAATLTSQLLAFSRRQIVQPRALDLNQVVTNLVKMLSSLIGENIRLITVLEPAPCLVKIDPGQLDQLLMNLALNARDAMLDGGTLTIETAAVPGETMAPLGLAELAPGPYVRLAVRDTGSGIDAETKSHIFEPFFTTKEQGKGTGLGLAMVYGIVAQNGGTITVDSAPGQETTFTIYLPRVSGAVGVVGQPDAPADPASRAETVLLVEDEPIVRKFVRDRLTSQGYQVLEAASGEEALQRAGQHQGLIHLLLTDVVMPGMNGRRLAEQIVAARPETKVLFMSGYTDDIVIRHGFQDIDTAFLQKPFELTALYHKVRELLDGPQGRHEY